jgi:trimethylamine--corrinoid protein Co-methyltransferase
MKAHLEILSAEEIQSIHEATIEVLSRTGVRLDLLRARRLAADFGCVVDDETRTVRFPPEVIAAALVTVPGQFTLFGADPAYSMPIEPDRRWFAPNGAPTAVLDFGSPTPRQATLADVTDHLILAEHLPHIDALNMPLWPTDIPMTTIHTESMLSWVANCRKPFSMAGYGVMATTDMIRMLGIVAGGDEALSLRPPFIGIVNATSPLVVDRLQIEGLMLFSEHGIPIVVGPQAMAGTTAPVTLSALLVQHNAENLALVALSQMVRPGAPVFMGSASTVSDMATGSIAVGAPETGVITAASAALARFYGIPSRGIGAMTDAKDLSAQCFIERTASILTAALGGVSFQIAAGTLESIGCSSAELLVVDDEMIGMVKRIVAGVSPDGIVGAANLIDEIGPGGSFLTHTHTQRNFRGELFMPRLFDRQTRETWEKRGGADTLARAHDTVGKILARHAGPDVDPKMLAELERYHETVKKRSIEEFYGAEWE